MDNNKTNNIDELTLMRSQMEELKAKLNREMSLNEASIRKLQKRNMGFIKKYLIFVWIALPVMILMYIGIKYMFGLSWLLTLVTIAAYILDVYLDTRFNRMKEAGIESMSLIEMSKKILWMKSIRRKQFFYGLSALILWAVWFAIEVYIGIDSGKSLLFPADHLFAVIMVACIVFGAMVGGIIGYMIYHKMQHDSDDIIEQINSLNNDDDM